MKLYPLMPQVYLLNIEQRKQLMVAGVYVCACMIVYLCGDVFSLEFCELYIEYTSLVQEKIFVENQKKFTTFIKYHILP